MIGAIINALYKTLRKACRNLDFKIIHKDNILFKINTSNKPIFFVYFITKLNLVVVFEAFLDKELIYTILGKTISPYKVYLNSSLKEKFINLPTQKLIRKLVIIC